MGEMLAGEHVAQAMDDLGLPWKSERPRDRIYHVAGMIYHEGSGVDWDTPIDSKSSW